MLQGWTQPSGEIILYQPRHWVPGAGSKPRSSSLTSTPPCLCMSPNTHTYTHPYHTCSPPGKSKTCNLQFAKVAEEDSWQKPNWNKRMEEHKEEESLQTTTILGHQEGSKINIWSQKKKMAGGYKKPSSEKWCPHSNCQICCSRGPVIWKPCNCKISSSSTRK